VYVFPPRTSDFVPPIIVGGVVELFGCILWMAAKDGSSSGSGNESMMLRLTMSLLPKITPTGDLDPPIIAGAVSPGWFVEWRLPDECLSGFALPSTSIGC